MIERKRPNLGGDIGRGQKSSLKPKESADNNEEEKSTGGALLGQKSARQRKAPAEDTKKNAAAKEDEEDDDILKKAKDSRTGGEFNKIIFAVMGIVVVAAVVVIFLLLSGGRSNKEQVPVDSGTNQVVAYEGAGEPVMEETAPELTDAEIGAQLGVGTQDFSGNTNMQTDATITDAEQYTKDIYGLTTRVDYNVDKILDVTDFVEYKKYRGTWGGGLELYWLSATYKGAKYVVQVPFKYYKELDEVGIVPVKMEVLTIKGEAEGDDRTIISYMCLDEETLKSVLKTQAKATGK